MMPYRYCAGLLAGISALCLTGCIQKVPPGESSSAPGSGAVAQAPNPPPQSNNGRITPDASGASSATAGTAAGGAAAPPMGGGPGSPPAAGAGGSGNQAALAKRASDLEGQYKKNPGNAALKKKLADALFQEGEAIMFDPSLPPRQKYRPSLLLFNRVLVLDPTNQKAAQYKGTIEQIYQQMGIPVPH